jgi:hypothetical protein
MPSLSKAGLLLCGILLSAVGCKRIIIPIPTHDGGHDGHEAADAEVQDSGPDVPAAQDAGRDAITPADAGRDVAAPHDAGHDLVTVHDAGRDAITAHDAGRDVSPHDAARDVMTAHDAHPADGRTDGAARDGQSSDGRARDGREDDGRARDGREDGTADAGDAGADARG